MIGALARPVLAGLLCQAAVGILRPALSYRALELGYDAFTIGLLAAAYALLPLVAALSIGRLVGRLRRLAVVPLAGALVLAVGCVLCAIAGDALLLGLGSALVGFGNLAVLLGAQGWITRLADSGGYDAWFGWLTAAMSIGQAVGPLAAGWLVAGPDGARAAFLAAAAVSLVLAIAVLSTAATDESERAPGVLGSAVRWVRSPEVTSAMLVSVALLTAVDILSVYLPVIGEHAGIHPAAVGALLALRGAASATSRLLLGVLTRRWSRDALVLAATIGGGVAMLLVGLVPWLPLLVVAMIVGGFLLGLGQPITMTQVALAVPAGERSSALAFRLVGNRIGQTLLPLVAGGLAVVGVGAAFVAQAGLLAAASVAAGVVAARRRTAGE